MHKHNRCYMIFMHVNSPLSLYQDYMLKSHFLTTRPEFSGFCDSTMNLLQGQTCPWPGATLRLSVLFKDTPVHLS